jgi:hypothetical protein
MNQVVQSHPILLYKTLQLRQYMCDAVPYGPLWTRTIIVYSHDRITHSGMRLEGTMETPSGNASKKAQKNVYFPNAFTVQGVSM